MSKKNTFYILATVSIIFSPLIVLKDAEFSGVDSVISDLIVKRNPNYNPWFEGFSLNLTPEMETFMFSFQAATGALIVGYIIGYIKGKRCGVK